MKSAEFDEILHRRFGLSESVMGCKAGEYASDKDRLHNFKAAAAMLGCTSAQALAGFLAKHIVSVMDLVRNDKTPSQQLSDEKIGDCINYFILLEAIWKEQRDEKKD